MFWKDRTGLRNSYKGWQVFLCGEKNTTKKDFAPYLKNLLAWLREYKSVDTVTLLLPVANQQHLGVYATIGLEEEMVQQIRIPMGEGIAGSIAANRKPLIVNDLSTVEIFSPILRRKNLRSLVGIPLPIGQDIVGVLHLGTFQSHQFTESDVEELESFAQRLGSVMAEAGVFNVEWMHNPEFCLENKGARKIRSRFSTLYQSFSQNVSAFGSRVLEVRPPVTGLN
jgi:L-methionine (R)-S-oxide reductase